MDKIEYLLFIPLLIYGISLSDLLSEYKRLIKDHVLHFKYLITILMLSEVAIFNIYKLYSIINAYDITTYLQYWALLIPPIIFMVLVHIFVIEERHESLDSMEQEFQKNIKPTFLLMSVYTATHFIPMMNPDGGIPWVRLLSIGLLWAYIIVRKDLVFYLLMAAWLVSFVLNINSIVI